MLENERFIIAATDEELDHAVYRYFLKFAVRNADISQREWPTAIQDKFLEADGLGLEYRTACGKPFPIPLVDDVWGNERYVREFLASEACEFPEKDRLIDLYYRTNLAIALLFGR